jgi:hypothetical protein
LEKQSEALQQNSLVLLGPLQSINEVDEVDEDLEKQFKDGIAVFNQTIQRPLEETSVHLTRLPSMQSF